MKQHFYLVACELLFTDTEGNSGATRLNVLSKSDTDLIRMKEIAAIQRGAQANLMQKLGTTELVVHDVIITNLSYCGYMTDEDFSEGLQALEEEIAAKTPADTAEAADPLAPGVLGNG